MELRRRSCRTTATLPRPRSPGQRANLQRCPGGACADQQRTTAKAHAAPFLLQGPYRCRNAAMPKTAAPGSRSEKLTRSRAKLETRPGLIRLQASRLRADYQLAIGRYQHAIHDNDIYAGTMPRAVRVTCKKWAASWSCRRRTTQRPIGCRALRSPRNSNVAAVVPASACERQLRKKRLSAPANNGRVGPESCPTHQDMCG